MEGRVVVVVVVGGVVVVGDLVFRLEDLLRLPDGLVVVVLGATVVVGGGVLGGLTEYWVPVVTVTCAPSVVGP